MGYGMGVVKEGILGNLRGFRGWVISMIKHHLVRGGVEQLFVFSLVQADMRSWKHSTIRCQ